MEMFDIILIGLILGFVATLYSSVGHGGASGYIAILAFFSLEPEAIRPIALALNVVVAGLATYKFTRAGYLDWNSALPIIAASMPLAFLGGTLTLPSDIYRPLLGALLVISAGYMIWQVSMTHDRFENASRKLPLVGSVSSGGVIGLASGLAGMGGGVWLSP